ncbi:hypothetical protein [Armatimonas rosea]|uniref:Uncharacterized protein n=1 Tax=Armatimonas rosea TaxID=685828 RepID=A0A7W9SSM1_ARMRO|nr:hypothetical protein [Armatimonas rosea]MBB6052107.1 hypothetical protein [Armatimonas rosea]
MRLAVSLTRSFSQRLGTGRDLAGKLGDSHLLSVDTRQLRLKTLPSVEKLTRWSTSALLPALLSAEGIEVTCQCHSDPQTRPQEPKETVQAPERFAVAAPLR